MAFQPQGGQESQNRRILQDLQQKRQMLLNQGQGSTAANVGTNLSTVRTTGADPSTSFKPHEAPVIRNPTDLSLGQRQALESLSWGDPYPVHGLTKRNTSKILFQHANATSSGYFISQDSAYGNLILPVLPRFENGELKMN